MYLGKYQTIDEAIEQNKNLVWSVIHKYYPSFVGDEDIVQIGTIALWRAIETFDPSYGVMFSTYAYKSIFNNIGTELRKRKMNTNCVSLDEKYSTENDGTTYTLADVIPAPPYFADTLSEYEIVLEQFFNSTNISARDRECYLRFIYGETQQEIANTMNYSRSFISRIIKNVQERLKLFLLKNGKEYADIIHS